MKEPSDLSIRARLFRGYGPMVAMLVSIITIALVIPSRVEVTTGEEVVDTSGAGFGDLSADTTVPGSDTSLPGPDAVVDTTAPATDAAVAPTGPGATGKGTSTQRSPVATVPNAQAAATACAGRAKEVPGDDYSPPCRPWVAGSPNGGSNGTVGVS